MLKNPNCHQCKDNKRVVAHYKWGRYTCNECKTTFRGHRTEDPDKQMLMEEIAKVHKLAEEKDKETKIST